MNLTCKAITEWLFTISPITPARLPVRLSMQYYSNWHVKGTIIPSGPLRGGRTLFISRSAVRFFVVGAALLQEDFLKQNLSATPVDKTTTFTGPTGRKAPKIWSVLLSELTSRIQKTHKEERPSGFIKAIYSKDEDFISPTYIKDFQIFQEILPHIGPTNKSDPKILSVLLFGPSGLAG